MMSILKRKIPERPILFLALVTVILYSGALSYFLLFESYGKHDSTNFLNRELGFPIYAADSTQYVVLGHNLLVNGVFSDYRTPPYVPNTMRTPVFPIIAAGLHMLTGTFISITIFQIILIFGVAVFIFLIGRQFFPVGLGLATAVVFLLDPTVIASTMVAQTDILFVFCIVAVTYLVVLKNNSGHQEIGKFFLYGIIFGLTALIRPIGLYYVFVLVPSFVILNLKKRTMQKLILLPILFVVGAALSLFPWYLRNHRVSGVWDISSISAYNLARYNIPNFLKGSKLNEFSLQLEKLKEQFTANHVVRQIPGQLYDPIMTDLRFAAPSKKLAMSFIKSDPVGYTVFHLKRSVYFFFKSSILHSFGWAPNTKFQLEKLGVIPKADDDGSYDDIMKTLFTSPRLFLHQAKLGAVLTVEKMIRMVLFVLMVLSLFDKNTTRKKMAICFWLIILYFAVLSSPSSNARYRMPAEPFMLVLAASGGYVLYENILKRFSH